ncbi:protein S100-A5 [Eschrichtius robustus]|uniref:protein S100-A5 n=1 Tax=Eschrichtius robustus TaxID=9764 RepID=UPI0035BFF9EC
MGGSRRSSFLGNGIFSSPFSLQNCTHTLETSLEKALTTMVTTFHKYSGREGSKLTLSRKELKELIKKDLCLGEKMKESNIDDLMKNLDKHSDQEMDFKQYSETSLEYSVFLTTLCVAYNDFFLADNQ